MQEVDLPLLMQAAGSASEIALKYWKTDMRVESKDGGSPVSEADYAVNAHLHDTLTAARPDYGWLSEESEDDPSRLSRETVFVVDPIDGTRAYLDGHPTWAISIAVVRNNEPVVGVVHLPARGKSYTAVKGGSARINGVEVRTGKREGAGVAKVLGSSSSLDPRMWARKPPILERHWRPSLAYRFCLLAEGRFDAVITLKDSWEWDIAAGVLIARQAGATVTDREGRIPFLNSSAARTAGVFAAESALHRMLISCYRNGSPLIPA